MKKKSASGDAGSSDFQFVLSSFLAAYRPILEKELQLSGSADQLQSESAQAPPTCEDEIKTAQELFHAFFSQEVAYRLLPDEGRETLGKPESWRWCYEHILCCLIFGWLVCRGPLTFKSFAAYLERYWRCVRQAIGQPVGEKLSPAEARDLRQLIQILAQAYTPYLQSQLRDAEYPMNLPEQIESGQVDCMTDRDQVDSVFERLMSPDAVRILFGASEASKEGNAIAFRACRCYCICALEFGCCLGRARTLREAVLCLERYFECLRRCFESLIGEIDTPTEGSCAAMTPFAACGGIGGIEITGTAAGSAFIYYTLTYSLGGPAINPAVVYPDCSRPPGSPSYNSPVVGGILGYIDFSLLPTGVNNMTIYLDVYGSGGLHITITRDVEVETKDVEIDSVATVQALYGPDPFHTADTIKLIKLVNDPNPLIPEQSIGGSVSVGGSAYTFGCGRQMTQYQLVLFPAPPASTVPTPPDASGASASLLPGGFVRYMDIPSHPWNSFCLSLIPNTIIGGGNLVAEWSTETCSFPSSHTIDYLDRGIKWASAPNGRFIIFLEVDDSLSSPAPTFPGTLAGVDQVAVWIDNFKPIADITSIGGISGCGDLHLSTYYKSSAAVDGHAWDYPIDPTAPQQAPNDNFGSYSLWFQKNGGASGTIPPLTPNTRVPNVWPLPPVASGTLSNWDISSHTTAYGLDGGPTAATCQPWQLVRGQQCAYVVVLNVVDTTWVNDGGDHNWNQFLYAINVINDIPLTLPMY